MPQLLMNMFFKLNLLSLYVVYVYCKKWSLGPKQLNFITHPFYHFLLTTQFPFAEKII